MSLARLIWANELNGKPWVVLECCGEYEKVTGVRTIHEAMAALHEAGKHKDCTTWEPN